MKIRNSAFFLFFLVVSCIPENLPPEASFVCTPPNGNIRTLFDLDAGSTKDPDGIESLLYYRWDIRDDGIWETGFGANKIFSWQFTTPGEYDIRLEVKDALNEVSSFKLTVMVDSIHHITDMRDGQVYPVVKVGTYWWMARNLNIGTAIDPSVAMTDNGVTEKYVYPGDDPEGLNGGLYTWNEMMGRSYTPGSQGICPYGWHVPTDADWKDLFAVFRCAGVRHYAPYWIRGEKFLTDRRVEHDNYLAEGAIWRLLRSTGSTGFDVVPVGYCDPDGKFSDRDYHFPGQTATFWTSTLSDEYAIRVRFYQTDERVGDAFRLVDNRRFAFSVRCVKETL
jgi:uncharacterized protein (TIGR02145 family)